MTIYVPIGRGTSNRESEIRLCTRDTLKTGTDSIHYIPYLWHICFGAGFCILTWFEDISVWISRHDHISDFTHYNWPRVLPCLQPMKWILVWNFPQTFQIVSPIGFNYFLCYLISHSIWIEKLTLNGEFRSFPTRAHNRSQKWHTQWGTTSAILSDMCGKWKLKFLVWVCRTRWLVQMAAAAIPAHEPAADPPREAAKKWRTFEGLEQWYTSQVSSCHF